MTPAPSNVSDSPAGALIVKALALGLNTMLSTVVAAETETPVVLEMLKLAMSAVVAMVRK